MENQIQFENGDAGTAQGAQTEPQGSATPLVNAEPQGSVIFENDENKNGSIIEDSKAPKNNIESSATEGVNSANEGEAAPQETYKQAFVKWAESNSFKVNGEIPDDLTEGGMADLVVKTHAINYAEKVDPFAAFLLEKGISYQGFQEELAPLQDLMEANSRDLYIYEKYNQALDEKVRAQLIDPQNEKAIQALWDDIAESASKMMEGMKEEQIDLLSKPYRDKYTEKYNETINGFQSIQQAKIDARKAESEAAQTKKVEQLTSGVNDFFKDNASVGTPEKEALVEFLKKELSYSEIDVLQKDGSSVKEKGIPFFHKLVNDDNFLLKVMNMLHNEESGKNASLVEKGKSHIVNKLNLFPTITPQSSKKVESGLRFEN